MSEGYTYTTLSSAAPVSRCRSECLSTSTLTPGPRSAAASAGRPRLTVSHGNVSVSIGPAHSRPGDRAGHADRALDWPTRPPRTPPRSSGSPQPAPRTTLRRDRKAGRPEAHFRPSPVSPQVCRPGRGDHRNAQGHGRAVRPGRQPRPVRPAGVAVPGVPDPGGGHLARPARPPAGPVVWFVRAPPAARRGGGAVVLRLAPAGWPGVVALAAVALTGLLVLRLAWPGWFARLVIRPGAQTGGGGGVYRRRWQAVLTIAGLAPRTGARSSCRCSARSRLTGAPTG